MPRTALFFANVHVPKCGGTTFQSILRRNFRDRMAEVYSPLWEQPYTAQQVAEFIADSPTHECLSTHRLSLDLPFDDERFELVAILFVRDPVDRFLSHYFYHRSVRHGRQQFSKLEEMSPDDYARYVMDSPSEHYLLDYQTWFLAQGGADSSIGRITDLCAKRHLTVLPLARFDESLLALQAMHPETFRDVRYAVQNVSPKDRPVAAETLEKLRARMPADSALYQLAHEQLDAQLAATFADRRAIDRTLAALRRACRRHDLLRERPVRMLKRFARWLGR